MKSSAFNPAELDVAAFAKQGAELDGQQPLQALQRLASSVHSDSAATQRQVAWRAQGELRKPRGGDPQAWVHLSARVEVMMECQRCLGPVAADLAIERSFLFVPGEDAAAELDVDSDDDVLALTRSLDLLALIEDELLLALPIVPRHDVCPQPLVAPKEDLPGDDAPHPFAALAALKRGGLPN